MINLKLKDITVDPSSYVDPRGFVFTDQGKLFRAIRTEHEDFYKDLFDDGTIDRLTREFGLVETSLTNFGIREKGCGMVLSHRRIEPLSYCVEWCPSMLREAALLTLRLQLALLERGCMLQDAYPWNVVFSGTKAFFVDFTSIVPASHPLVWPAYQQFLDFFMHPLVLSSLGKGKDVRRLLFDYVDGIAQEDYWRNLPSSYKWRHPLKWTSDVLLGKAGVLIGRSASLKSALFKATTDSRLGEPDASLRIRFSQKLLKTVEDISIRRVETSWTGYTDEEHAPGAKKKEIVSQLLASARAKTVLDLGSNTGDFSMMAARGGASVVSLDSDESCVEALFHRADKERLPILPLVGDALSPTPAYGFMASQFPPFTARARSEYVLCLGLMHHLHVRGRQSFEGIASLLGALSSRGVIFEFIDEKDPNCGFIHHGRPFKYSEEDVLRALGRYFRTTAFPSDRPTRKIILCEK